MLREVTRLLVESDAGSWARFATRDQIESGMLEEFLDRGGVINSDGSVTVYHGTTKEFGPLIVKSGILKNPPGTSGSGYGVYVSTSPDIAEDYGDGIVVKCQVPFRDLHLDDAFPSGRMDFRIETRGGTYKIRNPSLRTIDAH